MLFKGVLPKTGLTTVTAATRVIESFTAKGHEDILGALSLSMEIHEKVNFDVTFFHECVP